MAYRQRNGRAACLQSCLKSPSEVMRQERRIARHGQQAACAASLGLDKSRSEARQWPFDTGLVSDALDALRRTDLVRSA